MKILIDMNISPDWVDVFQKHGWQALHWSEVGDPCATDITIMQWANNNGYVVFTHDLDFGTLLATTRAKGPSVIQIRTQDILNESFGQRVIKILGQYKSILEKGAIIVVDENKARARILPFP